MSAGSAEKIVPLLCHRKVFGAGFSKLARAMSAPLIRSRTRALVAGPPGDGGLPAERGTADEAGDLRGPAAEGKVGALALDHELLVDAAVEHDVAAGKQGPGRGGIERIGCRCGRELRRQRPVGDVGHPVAAEECLPLPGQGAHPRPDRVRPQEPESLAVLGEVLLEGRGVLRLHESCGLGRPVHAERGKDGVGLGADELERLVPRIRPGQHGLDLGDGRAGHGAPELRDGDDRDVGDGRRGLGRGCARRAGGGGTWRGARVRGAGRRQGRRRRARPRDDRTGRAGRGTRGPEPELAPGHGDGDGQRDEAEDDDDRSSGHGRDRTSGTSLPGRRTPRPGGRTGRG